jgi:tetratricopeptide (TPR) repeat protein
MAEKHGGDLAHLAELPVPTADEPRYERVHRVLRRYDEHLTESEREFLKLFSAFRTPVHENAFGKVFAPLLGVGATGRSPLPEMVKRLAIYRILKHDPASQTYTAHPLVRNHYLAILTHDTGAPETHTKIKDYYLSLAGDTPTYPTLEDLKPLIEVVYHACQAGAYQEADRIRRERIYQGAQGSRLVIMHQLGAYETTFELLKEFFPNRDVSETPLFDPSFYVVSIGFCLMSLGRLREAVPFYERGAKSYVEAQDWHNASRTYQNLAGLHAALGALDQSAAAVRQALDLARKAENKDNEATSQSWLGTATHLLGKTDEASSAFLESERLRREAQPNIRFLYSFSGIRHADHLRRTGQAETARRVTEANLQICERNHWPDDTSRCHRVLGDLDSDANNHASARAHYETALKVARGISYRPALIEALLARGRWAAKLHAVGASRPARTEVESGGASMQTGAMDGPDGSPLPLEQAFNDLNEALNYAVEGGYRIYEADIHVALGWAWLAVNRETLDISARQKAKAEAERALEMSREMLYHWGQVDAREVLGEIEKQEKRNEK